MKRIEFKADFERTYMTGDTEIIPIHEATGEIIITMIGKHNQDTILKMENYFMHYDKNITLQPNGDIVYIYSGNFCRLFRDYKNYVDNVLKIGFE